MPCGAGLAALHRAEQVAELERRLALRVRGRAVGQLRRRLQVGRAHLLELAAVGGVARQSESGVPSSGHRARARPRAPRSTASSPARQPAGVLLVLPAAARERQQAQDAAAIAARAIRRGSPHGSGSEPLQFPTCVGGLGQNPWCYRREWPPSSRSIIRLRPRAARAPTSALLHPLRGAGRDAARRRRARSSQARVCDACGMGVLLSCTREALPGRARRLRDRDRRAEGERRQRRRRGDLRPRADGGRAVPARSADQPDGRRPLRQGRDAARPCASREPVVMPVQGRRAPAAGTLAARISTCGPPRAALVTVEPSGFGRR